MTHFFDIYFGLVRQNLTVKKIATIFFFELIGSFFSIVAIFLLGFVIQVMTLGDATTHKVFATFDFNVPIWVIALVAIALNIILLCSSAASYFHSVKLCRKYARAAYTNSLDRNIRNFENSSVSELSLKSEELDSFRSFFTGDSHLTFVSMEAMLRAIRPISLIVVFLVPLVVLELKVLYFLIALVFIVAPFLLKINRDTASSAKKVFGAERKKVYAEIMSSIRGMDKDLIPNLNQSAKAYDEMKMGRMLDGFDYWKLSSDKVAYVMTIVKSVGLQLVIIILVGSLYYYEGIPVSTMAILGMGLLKIQEAFLGFFSRLTVLSRLYPIVKRYRNLEQKFGLSALELDRDKEDYSNNPLLISGKLICISRQPDFKKSEISMLNEQLSSYDSAYDIRALALGECVEVVSDKPPVDERGLEELLNRYIEEEGDSDVFLSLKEQVGAGITVEGERCSIGGDIFDVWERINLKSRLFVYFLVFQMDDNIQYFRCSIRQIELVKLIADEAFKSNFKPVVVFENDIAEDEKKHFDIVLCSMDFDASEVGVNDVEF